MFFEMIVRARGFVRATTVSFWSATRYSLVKLPSGAFQKGKGDQIDQPPYAGG